MFRRSGYRFADKNMRKRKDTSMNEIADLGAVGSGVDNSVDELFASLDAADRLAAVGVPGRVL